MLDEWALSSTVPIFKGKGDIMNCGWHTAVKFLDHVMKVAERALVSIFKGCWTRDHVK